MELPRQDSAVAPESGDLTEIVAACRRGDRAMQRELFERCRDPVFRLAARMIGPQEAVDVSQQVFLRVFQSLNKFSGRSSFMTWLYRVTANECLQWIRQNKRRPADSLGFDPTDRRPSGIHALMQKDLLESALARIDPDLRCVFLLREVEELSYAGIAEVLEIAEGTVASRLNRARHELQVELRTMGWSG
jgi:RNA polymerase sigma-70 factor (ECF subfamily)